MCAFASARQPPPTAIEHRLRQRPRKAPPQDFVDLPLRRRKARRHHRFDRQGAERQADPAISHMLVDRFRDFEAAAAYIADRADGPEEPRDNPKGREPRFFAPAEDTHLQAGLRLYRRGELRPVGSATHGLGRHGVDSSNPHGVGDGAKSPHSLDRSTKIVRRDGAGLGEPFGEAAERFFIEARHRRPAELVIDQEPDRVRADVDDRIGRPVDPLGALGVELKRPRRRSDV